MAWNKKALIRYKTIDKCLQNKSKKWTLEALIDACSQALIDQEDKESYISKRTIQGDIQIMRSDKLGYNAPIVVYEKKYYKYEDEDYSITKIPLTEIDLNILTESIEMLKQFKNFSLFEDLNSVLVKLEDKIYNSSENKTIVHIDKNEQLKGLEHIDIIYQSIIKKIVLSINYQSFNNRKEQQYNLSGYILKEFNNRWFIIGKNNNENTQLTLALDRILAININLKAPYVETEIDPDKYFENTYGVTVLNDKSLITIEFLVNKHNAPYVITKPFHKSQELLKIKSDGSMYFKIRVHHNYEIERLFLSFADAIEIIKPNQLRKIIKQKLRKGLKYYE